MREMGGVKRVALASCVCGFFLCNLRLVIHHICLSLYQMDINELSTTANELDDKNRSAILKIIDFKTETDMEKILAKMDAKFLRMEGMFAQVNSKMDSKFAQIDAKFLNMDARFTHLESKMDSKFAHVEDKISTMKWVIYIAGGILTLIVGFLALKIK